LSAGWAAGLAAIVLVAIVLWVLVRSRRKPTGYARGGFVADRPSDRPVARPPTLGLVGRDRPFEPINHRDREMGFEPPFRAPAMEGVRSAEEPLDLTERAAPDLRGTGGLHEALTGETPTERTGLDRALNGPSPLAGQRVVLFRRYRKLPKAPRLGEPVGWTEKEPTGSDPLFRITGTRDADGVVRNWSVTRVTPPKPMGRRPTKATATTARPRAAKVPAPKKKARRRK
jgi:hypothetical protein